ncbi:hypothetical protein ACFL5O_10590, partial [Myxococcota bacterium]
MVTRYGGRLEVSSEPGKGTHFVVRLPATIRVAHTTEGGTAEARGT